MTTTKPRLGVFKFASCDGCQLSLLDCEDELLAVADRVEIAYFLEATRRPLEGEFDVALVEGSVSTPGQEEEIRDIRRRARFLITLGACASDGGIQGLRNFGSLNVEGALAIVYASPQYVETLAHSRPASAYVPVDLELPGCPINKEQLLGVLGQMLAGGRPKVPNHALCLDCKRQHLVCVLVAHGTPCMGPVTSTGCGVLCPSYDRPCYSCFGPSAQPNTTALARRFEQLGLGPEQIRRLFHKFYANAPEFKEAGQRMPDQPPDEVIEGNATAQSGERLIRVAALARVEGEGALTIRLRDGRVDDVQLRIFEAPRFFEALLRGRDIAEVPDITARICGICPVAYQMSACHALEALLGLTLPDPIRALRRLLYCGEWIESHVLHISFLHAPDFLGYESAFAMAQDRPEFAVKLRDALQLKKAGNAIVDLVGGRAIHPINVRLGGFYRAPSKSELATLAEQLKRAKEITRNLVRWTAKLAFPPLEYDYEFVALRHESEYPMNEGRLVSNRGLDIAMDQFPGQFEEYQVPYSNALQCRRKGGGAYFVGPLARWNLCADQAGTEIQQLAGETGIAWPCRNPYTSIVARALETAYAVDEALRLIMAYDTPATPAVEYEPRAGSGAWITEAPRGILYHRYESDASGHVTLATIIPPTSQNQRQIEEDLIRFAPSVLGLPEDQAAWRCEQVVRNYDPCISCATHSLKLRIVES